MINFNLCAICGDSITDPICKSCYIKQTLVLLVDLKISPITNDFINKKLKEISLLETLNDTECILCKKDTASICHYCFSIALIRILREINFPENLIENFEYLPIYDENSLENENKLNIIAERR